MVDKWNKKNGRMDDFLFLAYTQLQYYFCLNWILIGNNILNITNNIKYTTSST